MKKAAILSIATFYLLLTTGMFVCLIHCAGESFFQPKMAMQGMNPETHHGQQHKHCGKNCDCCNKHGDYVIKENIKPSVLDVQISQVAVLPRQFDYIFVAALYPALNVLSLQYGKAPPGLSGKAISIQLHSLQI
jgi:hypothetical protein